MSVSSGIENELAERLSRSSDPKVELVNDYLVNCVTTYSVSQLKYNSWIYIL
jgi:hypothetical protein